MVKKFVVSPKKREPISKMVLVKGSKAITQKGKIIRQPNRAVPLNPNASKNNPRAGTFATRRRLPKIG